MLFNSFSFFIFFGICLFLYPLVNKDVAKRNVFLLILSYFFYSCWDWRFLSLIISTTVINFFCGIMLEKISDNVADNAKKKRRKKTILLLSLITNLGTLAFFKYFNFFIQSTETMLGSLGFATHYGTLNIILPVGISFYTFQALSYTIDVYRDKITAEKNGINFALYVAFFPQLVAGPIERASHLLPQMRKILPVTQTHVYTGAYLIFWGLFKKVAIADNVALIVDKIFAMHSPTGLDVIIGSYAFAIQIYCDFSGYSDIARGTARCLGFDIMSNFNFPYFSANPSEFWKRWHISLSTWLRDYLYIPLGGSRKSKLYTLRNVMITMALCGLWHGANFTFLFWGLFHGLLLCAYHITKSVPHITTNEDHKKNWLKIFLFFNVLCIGWIFFRAETITHAIQMISAIFTNMNITKGTLINISYIIPILLLLAIFEHIQITKKSNYIFFNIPVLPRSILYSIVIILFIMISQEQNQSFIYFQF